MALSGCAHSADVACLDCGFEESRSRFQRRVQEVCVRGGTLHTTEGTLSACVICRANLRWRFSALMARVPCPGQRAVAPGPTFAGQRDYLGADVHSLICSLTHTHVTSHHQLLMHRNAQKPLHAQTNLRSMRQSVGWRRQHTLNDTHTPHTTH